MSARQECQLVVQAVLMAIWQRPTRTAIILYSDRGCQFSSEEYQQFLAAHEVTYSMSTVGSCADHVAAESFFGVLKRERGSRRQCQTRAEARADIVYYIEAWHHPLAAARLEATGAATLKEGLNNSRFRSADLQNTGIRRGQRFKL